MPRSKNDPHKRRCAQALNHLANAVVDMNDVYEAFDQSITRMRETAKELEVKPDVEAIQRYETYKERIKQLMMYIVIPREEILKLVNDMWGLDEETIRVYLG
jgi:predicted patatin/cPLA2 family phospholipase